MTHRRVDWGDRGEPEFVDVPYWRVAGSWGTGGFVFGFCICLILLTTCDARAGGMEQQQQQTLAPEQLAAPNAPVQLPPHPHDQTPTVVIDGGTSVGEWAALLTGIAALLGALEAFRRRRHRIP